MSFSEEFLERIDRQTRRIDRQTRRIDRFIGLDSMPHLSLAGRVKTRA